jgi:hypothetical protein
MINIKKKVTKLIDKLNYYFGIRLFNSPNLFSYNVFNHFLKKNICNKSYLSYEFINTYYNNGYSKLDKISDSEIDQLNKLLKEYNPNPVPGNTFSYNFLINEEILNYIKNIINSNIINYIKVFEKYYNLPIILADIKIQRNYSYSSNKEMYANFFHCDGYIGNLFKVFINLEDINESQGPLNFVKKDKYKSFLKLSNYNNRNNYNDEDPRIDECIYKNIGKKGDVLLCNTTELLHRAGDVAPNESRDILFLEFIAYPFDNNTNIYSFEGLLQNRVLDKKFSKIEGIRNLFKLYKLCKKNRLESKSINA